MARHVVDGQQVGALLRLAALLVAPPLVDLDGVFVLRSGVEARDGELGECWRVLVSSETCWRVERVAEELEQGHLVLAHPAARPLGVLAQHGRLDAALEAQRHLVLRRDLPARRLHAGRAQVGAGHRFVEALVTHRGSLFAAVGGARLEHLEPQRLHHLHEGEGGGRDPHEGEGGGRDPHEGEGGGREGRGGKRGRQAGPPFGGLLDERAVLARGSGLDLVRVEGEGAGEVEARE